MSLLIPKLLGCVSPDECFEESVRTDEDREEVTHPVALHFFKDQRKIQYDLSVSGYVEPEDIEQVVIDNLNSGFQGTNISFYHAVTHDHSELCSEIEVYSNDLDLKRFFEAVDDAPETMDVYVCDVDFFPVDIQWLKGDFSFALGVAEIAEDKLIVKSSRVLNGTLYHEAGHALGLFHTFETYFGTEKADGSNAKTAGDFISDTPADPQCELDFDSDALDPELVCPVDRDGSEYALLANNIMSSYYEYISEQAPSFTPEQAEVMSCVLRTKLWEF